MYSIVENPKTKESETYQKILSGSFKKLDFLFEEEVVKDVIKMALNKTLNNIKEGKLSPAVFPIIIEKDLKLGESNLALELAIICAFFHTSADLADDVEDDSKDNSVINKYGKSQAINISDKLLFISLQLIFRLNISDSNKAELFGLFSKCGNEMSTGQFYDLASTNRRYFPDGKKIEKEDIKSISKKKTGMEIACFISCLFVALNKPYILYYNLGLSFGSLIQVFSDYVDIWGKSKSEDIVSLKNSLPVYSSYSDPNFSKSVRVSLAGKNDLLNKQHMLKRILAKTTAKNVFDNYLDECFLEIKDILESLPELKGKRFQEIIDDLRMDCEFISKILKELSFNINNTHVESASDIKQTIDIALEFLQYDDNFKDTWEIQRWGFLGEPLLLGNIFAPALIFETLSDMNLNIDTNLEDLLKLRRKNGWNYFSNTSKIPTDSDDLGQLLNLTGKTGNKDKYYSFFREPLEILENNIEKNGRCPTWLSDDEHSKEDIEKIWFGNDCIGVMANLYYGLLLFDKKRFISLINTGIEYIMEKFEDFQNAPVAYYKHSYVFYLVSRLVNAMNLKFDSLNKVREQMLKAQLLNGSWDNSPQNTAFVLLAMMSFQELDEISLKTAMVYLCDTQNYDGSWDAEDLFTCPGKEGRFTYYKNLRVTTSFCIRALVQGFQG